MTEVVVLDCVWLIGSSLGLKYQSLVVKIYSKKKSLVLIFDVRKYYFDNVELVDGINVIVSFSVQ